MLSYIKNKFDSLAGTAALCWAYAFPSPEERALCRALSRARNSVKEMAQATEYLERITQLYLDPKSDIFLENERLISGNTRLMCEQRELIAEYESFVKK